MKAKNTINYEKSLEFLNNLAHFSGEQSIDAIKKILETMDNFQDRLNVIHVTGTNGKGSTIKYLESVYLASRYSVGVFTSPYILSVNECTRINGEEISNNDLASCLNEVKTVCENKNFKLSEFEMLTVISLLEMSKKKVDIAIIEVGIGAPLDATNIFKNKTCVFTTIDVDHEKLLGRTPEEVAKTKSEIITKNGKVVIGQNSPEIVEIIKQKAKEMSCEVFIAEQKKTKDTELYTEKNAFSALTTIKALQKKFQVSKLKAIEIIKKTKLELRLDWINNSILIDSAHNLSGIKALEIYLNKKVKPKKIVCVFGVLRDKKYDRMLEVVKGFSDEVILTKALSERAHSFEGKKNYYPDFKLALDKALSIQGDFVILVCGSFYLTAHAKKYLLEKLCIKSKDK